MTITRPVQRFIGWNTSIDMEYNPPLTPTRPVQRFSGWNKEHEEVGQTKANRQYQSSGLQAGTRLREPRPWEPSRSQYQSSGFPAGTGSGTRSAMAGILSHNTSPAACRLERYPLQIPKCVLMDHNARPAVSRLEPSRRARLQCQSRDLLTGTLGQVQNKASPAAYSRDNNCEHFVLKARAASRPRSGRGRSSATASWSCG